MIVMKMTNPSVSPEHDDEIFDDIMEEAEAAHPLPFDEVDGEESHPLPFDEVDGEEAHPMSFDEVDEENDDSTGETHNEKCLQRLRDIYDAMLSVDNYMNYESTLTAATFSVEIFNYFKKTFKEPFNQYNNERIMMHIDHVLQSIPPAGIRQTEDDGFYRCMEYLYKTAKRILEQDIPEIEEIDKNDAAEAREFMLSSLQSRLNIMR